MSVSDEKFLTLRLQYTLTWEYCRHNDEERQALSYLALKIWTIFNSIQITGNDAHAGAYIAVSQRLSYISQAWAFYLLLMEGSPEPQCGNNVISSRLFCMTT